MGRQNNDQAVLQSSILLLQERFRKLQRLKEMREEQEYQRMFSGGRGRQSPSAAAAAQFEQPKWFFHSDLVRPSRPLCEPHQESSHGDQTGFHEFETASSMSLPQKMTNVCCSLTASESDVDTSLHL